MGIAAAAAAALDGGLYFFCVPLHGPYLSGPRPRWVDWPLHQEAMDLALGLEALAAGG